VTSSAPFLSSSISLLLCSPLTTRALTSLAWPQQQRSQQPQQLLVGNGLHRRPRADLRAVPRRRQPRRATLGEPPSGLGEELNDGQSRQAAGGWHRELFRYTSRREATRFYIFSLLDRKVHLCFASYVGPKTRHSAPRKQFSFCLPL
jgi:hypothetical protein